jgi:hypothetical protein
LAVPSADDGSGHEDENQQCQKPNQVCGKHVSLPFRVAAVRRKRINALCEPQQKQHHYNVLLSIVYAYTKLLSTTITPI